MNRKETTKFLSNLLESELKALGRYYAKEVTIDNGSSNVKRVDFMEFTPGNGVFISGIEKGVFTCYEVKSCLEDVYSGNGLNFLGEKNYIVTDMATYKKIVEEIQNGRFDEHIRKVNPESSRYYGIMVAVPEGRKPEDEFATPTPLETNCRWTYRKILPCRQGPRRRSITELLFCMLRAK